MTLTDLMPSLRRVLPDPLDPDSWPELTSATPSDVVVSGVSLTRLAEICETPCVHTARALLPHSFGRPSPTESATTVVVRILSVTRHPSGAQLVAIDADLSQVDAVLTETRLLGRVSTAHDAHTVLASASGWPVESLAGGLPSDLREGDLLAFPCHGLVTLHDVRPHGHVDVLPTSHAASGLTTSAPATRTLSGVAPLEPVAQARA
jgi:hypothetical protein